MECVAKPTKMLVGCRTCLLASRLGRERSNLCARRRLRIAGVADTANASDAGLWRGKRLFATKEGEQRASEHSGDPAQRVAPGHAFGGGSGERIERGFRHMASLESNIRTPLPS
jgi:hypothetical protein